MKLIDSTLKFAALCSLILAVFAVSGIAQTERKPIDLRRKLEHVKLKEGTNLVYSNKTIKISVEVKDGKVLGFTAVDGEGKVLPMTQKAPPSTGGRRPCIYCWGLDTVLESHCIEIPCWLLPYFPHIPGTTKE